MNYLKTFPEAILPNKKQLRARTNLMTQAIRFIILNIKMIRMIFKGHH